MLSIVGRERGIVVTAMNQAAETGPADERTLFAVLTPPGRGAVATVGVRGPRAVEIVARRFAPAAGKPLTKYPVGRVLFGRFRGSGGADEELVVGLVSRNEVEVHCHGGLAAVEAIAAALVAEGATRIDWRTWSQQIEPDLLASEALVALADARTERTADVLLDQYRGALRSTVRRIEGDLRRADAFAAAAGLSRLLGRTELGRHLTRPWRVVIAGRPNAGKSSLMNALLGFQRSIVFAEPGTTRDVLTATTALDGWPVELADTAGLRTSGDAVEAEGVERALRQVRGADLVLLVCDVTAEWSNQDRDVLATGKRALVIHHKCDLADPPSDGRPVGLAVSSLSGHGIEVLCSGIATRLVPNPPQSGEGVPINDRQTHLLKQALDAAERHQFAAAGFALAELTKP